MNFFDLSAVSEDERRRIRELLSTTDTSIVNIAQPKLANCIAKQQQQQPLVTTASITNTSTATKTQTHTTTTASMPLNTYATSNTHNHYSAGQFHHHHHNHYHHPHHHNNHQNLQQQHRVPSLMQAAKLDHKNNAVNIKNQTYHSTPNQNQFTSNNLPQTTSNITATATTTTTTTNNNHNNIRPVPPSAAQMPPMAGDMNSVIAMDMTSPRPPGYAISTPVAPFPGPPPAHVYGVPPPLFQPHYPHYLIPYNMHPYGHPYVIQPNSVVPPRVVPPHANRSINAATNTNTGSSLSRAHSNHVSTHPRNHEPYRNNNCNSQTNHIQSEQGDHVENNCSSNQNQNQNQNNLDKPEKQQPCDAKIEAASNKLQHASAEKSEIVVSPENPDQAKCSPMVEDSSSNNRQNSSQDSLDKSNKMTFNNKINNIAIKNGSASAGRFKKPLSNPRIDKVEAYPQKSESNSLSSKVIKGHSTLKNNQAHSDQDASTNAVPVIQGSDENQIKSSSDEGFDTQSSLDMSKQSHESSVPINDNPDSPPVNYIHNEISTLPHESNDIKCDEKSNRGNGALLPASSKSWADLFKRGGNNGSDSNINGYNEENSSNSENLDDDDKVKGLDSGKLQATVKTNTPNSSEELRSQELAKRALDKMAPRLAQKITNINLKHSLPFLKPRGFINKGNGCYINATLQALIACPPFYNLMKEIGDLRNFKRDQSCTPIIDSFAELFLNFPPLDTNKKSKQSSPADQRLNINSLQAESIEPKCIYNVLGQIKSECLKGAQEDAEEFLSSVLNGLHDEMIGLLELQQNSQDTINHNGHQRDLDDTIDDVTSDDNLWREVGPKNRSLPIRTAKVVNTPIQEIFGGSLFSIRTAGKDRCGHRSPFFDLQLDISAESVKSVQDAIKSFTAPETINDFYCSKTKQKLDAQRRTSLDQLPPILILHLKQFVYSQDYGLKKLMKKIEYPIDFELPESCLHEKGSTDKNLRTSRSYKLLAVVYHDGREAVKGHYLTDVYHIGSSQWIRCDDSNLKVISSPRIENPDSTRTPYLLFYRRLNTLRAQSSNHDNKKKN